MRKQGSETLEGRGRALTQGRAVGSDSVPTLFRAPVTIDVVSRRQLLDRVESRLFSKRTAIGPPILASRYQLTKLLGAGGMGVVYSALDPVLEREVAIKFVRSGSGISRRDLLSEARTLARLAHPNVVPVHDVGTCEPADFDELLGNLGGDQGIERTFIVMECVQGLTLDRWLTAKGRSRREIIDVFLQAAIGLAAAHAVGIVHRDFKPNNVMVSESGHARVLDFGLARRLEDGRPSSQTGEEHAARTDVHPDQTLLPEGGVIGTPAYMAPEQHKGEHCDARSDQYSFCLALLEALTGARLFRGVEPNEVAREKVRGSVLVSGARPLPRKLRRLVLRGTALDRSERFASMDAIVERLRAVLQTRRRWVAIVGASFVGGLGLAALVQPSDRSDCEAIAAEALANTWSTEQRLEVARAFQLAPRSYSATSWSTTREALDSFAERWVSRREDHCRSDPTLKEAPDAAATCLDTQREQVSALVDVLRDGDAAVIASAVSLVEMLPSPEDCHSASRPASHRTQESTRAIAKALVDDNTGNRRLARVVVSDELVMHEGHPSPSSASLHLVRAGISLRLGEPSAAEQDARRAWELAEQSADTQLVSMAMIALVSVHRAQARFSDADSLLSVLAARISATKSGDAIEGRLLAEKGELAWVQREYADAIVALDAAADTLGKVRGPTSSKLRQIWTTRALASARLGKVDVAIQLLNDLLETQGAQIGHGHPALASIELDLGNVLREAGQPEAALRHVRRARELLESSGVETSLERTEVLELEGALELALGRAIAAERLALELIGEQTDRLGIGHPQLGDAYSTLALARSLRGDPDGALIALNSAERANNLSSRSSIAVSGLIKALQCDAKLQLQETEQAVDLCAAAVAAWEESAPEHYNTALLQMIYAVALSQDKQQKTAVEQLHVGQAILHGKGIPRVAKAQGLMLEGEVHFIMGDRTHAMSRFGEAASLLEQDPGLAPAEWVRIHLRMATIAGMNGERAVAESFARRGARYAVTRGLQVEVAAAVDSLLATLITARQPNEARALQARSLRTWKRLGTAPSVIAEHNRWIHAVSQTLDPT